MRRKNKEKSKHVERAIRFADKGFTLEAGIICYSNDIPFDVALRVITRPSRRRHKQKYFK